VGFLEGDTGSETQRRNRIDDRNLRLLLAFCLQPGSNCLEVGANRGIFLHEIDRVAPDGRHIVYEPVPNQAERLARMFPRMDVRQRALSDRNGQSRFVRVVDVGSQGLSRLEGAEGGPLPPGVRSETIVVETDRLDDHLPDGWLPDFVKIDVEGAELAVLRGAIETLRRARPIVALEVGWQPGVADEIYALLCDDVGLRLFDMDGHGPMDRSRYREACRTRWNWVAHL
jgi:FkbM family methyltransferase